MIFADLPFGTTNMSWDKLIPMNDYVLINNKPFSKEEFLLYCFKKGKGYKESLEEFSYNKIKGLWYHYERIIKDNGAILLFAQTPFDKYLGESNKKLLRYEWIWEKTKATGHLNAKKMPMKAHENILVFYKKLPTYNPQKTDGKPYRQKRGSASDVYQGKDLYETISDGGRHPLSWKIFKRDKDKTHPTQRSTDRQK